MNAKHPSPVASRLDAGVIAQFGALVSAVVASACCWLPLLLIAVGVSGGTLSATLESWRPVLLPATFLLLGAAFCLTYRRPKAPAAVLAGAAESCCPPENTREFRRKKVNKAIPWAVTVFVLAFALFPNYVGYLLGGDGTLAARDDLDKVVVQIDGMTCEACAAGIEAALRKVPGVAVAEVSYEKREAVIGYPPGARISPQAILDVVNAAGAYTGRFRTREGAGLEDH